jgi:hypothetical protein
MRKKGDTIFLSTETQWKCQINAFENNQTVTNPWFHVAIKIYEYSYSNKKYEYTRDAVGAYDSTINSFVIEGFVFHRGNYIMVYEHYPASYRVKCSFKNTDNNYVAIEENPDYIRGVIFNEFPLLVKRNRLIPIDEEKQMQCWLDNGFFFPKMKISKKGKEYNIIDGHYIGLRNLPAEMKQGISKPLPRKYLKYLNNK